MPTEMDHIYMHQLVKEHLWQFLQVWKVAYFLKTTYKHKSKSLTFSFAALSITNKVKIKHFAML